MSDQQVRPYPAGNAPGMPVQTTSCDACCIQSEGQCLWVDPSDRGKHRVFYTHAPMGRGGVFPADEILMGEEEFQMLRGKKTLPRCFLREGWPSEEVTATVGEMCGSEVEKSAFVPVCDGDRFSVGACEVRCIHTPGPTPGHTCLYLPQERVLFAGALLNKPPHLKVWGENQRTLENLLKSLERIKELPVKRVFPDWDGTATLEDRADQIIRNCYFRILELLRLVQDHPGLTAYELAARFFRHEQGWEELPAQRRWEALEETLVYLSYLRERDYVRAVTEHGVRVNVPGKRRLTDVV